jgi:hypothetical protein
MISNRSTNPGIFIFIFMLLFVLACKAQADNEFAVMISKKSVTRSLGVEEKLVSNLQEKINAIYKKGYEPGTPEYIDPISSYESPIPNKTKAVISDFEKTILAAYLDNPNDIQVTQFLSFYHLERSLLNKKQADKVKALTSSIIALYFLNRVQDLGGKDKWVDKGIKQLSAKIDSVAKKKKNTPVSIDESHESHAYFIDAFNYHEENRYIAQDKLIRHFIDQNNNLHTAHLLEAVTLWNGGEAKYGDPTILYHFVLGSYFSIIAMSYGKELEGEKEKNLSKQRSYRLATIMGAFTSLHRGWLAYFHQDQKAIDLVDNEHRQWLKVHKIFHSFTFSLWLHDKPGSFEEALTAMKLGSEACLHTNPPRTCTDNPRFSFNLEGFALNKVDLLLKVGELETAKGWMNMIQHGFLNFAYWDLGKDAYQHRMENLEEISTRFRNDNPDDDPLLFSIRKQKWGKNPTTCQGCHQAQSKVWTQEEKDLIVMPPEEYARVGNWPKVSTEWYGAVKNL